MTSRNRLSQKEVTAGGPTLLFAILAIVWNGLVYGLMLSASHIPRWFNGLFVVIGGLFVLATVLSLYFRLVGGRATLVLPSDPVPQGVPVVAKFELAKAVQAHPWSVELKIQRKGPSDRHFRPYWRHTFAAEAKGPQLVQSTFVFPQEFSPKSVAGDGGNYLYSVTLVAGRITWAFWIEPRDASPGELAFAETGQPSANPASRSHLQ